MRGPPGIFRAVRQTRFGGGDERYRYARPQDIASIETMLDDPEVGRYLWFVPAPAGMIAGFFKPMIEAQWSSLADGRAPAAAVIIVESETGEFLGQGAAIAIEGSPGGFEIGYQLPKASWGRGVGTRLAEFLVALSVHEHGAFRIEANLLEGNTGSEAIARKLGLQREGVRPDYRLKGGKRVTEHCFGARVDDLDTAMLERATARAAFDDED